jgi:hypothetical protein
VELRKTFEQTIFKSRVINAGLSDLESVRLKVEEADRAEFQKQLQAFEAGESEGYPADPSHEVRFITLSVTNGNEVWDFDDLHEWLAAYDRQPGNAGLYFAAGPYSFSVSTSELHRTDVAISAPSSGEIARFMRFFNDAEPESKVAVPAAAPPAQPPVVVFIGHGRSADWRDIKDHLRDSHHYAIEAYEVGSRAGHSIRDVLASMLEASSFALLVMTAEDESAEGDARARQNVVHEAGLFQGKLGFNRAIAVVESGVEVFSNLDGVQQIRYDKGNVKATFGEILATLRREFGDRR